MSPDGSEKPGAGRPKRGHILAQGVVRFLLVALSSELPQIPADYLVTWPVLPVRSSQIAQSSAQQVMVSGHLLILQMLSPLGPLRETWSQQSKRSWLCHWGRRGGARARAHGPQWSLESLVLSSRVSAWPQPTGNRVEALTPLSHSRDTRPRAALTLQLLRLSEVTNT